LKELVQLLVNVAGRDGNLLLNVAPKADGTFEPDHVARLEEIGAWLRKNGESIYETRGGPFLPDKDFTSTCRGNTVYLHLLNKRSQVTLPEIEPVINSIGLLADGPVVIRKDSGGRTILVDNEDIDETDTIVVMELNSPAELMKPIRINESH
jgi:alpha-L-fucosidase